MIDSEPSWRPIPIIVEDKIEITELSDENESSNEQLEFNESYMKVRVYFISLDNNLRYYQFFKSFLSS